MNNVELNNSKDSEESVVTINLTKIPDDMGLEPVIKQIPCENRCILIPYGSPKISGVVDFNRFLTAFLISNNFDGENNLHVFYPTSDENPKTGIHYIFTETQASTIESAFLNHLQGK